MFMNNRQKILTFFASALPSLAIILIIGGLLMAYILKRPDFAIRGMIWAIPIILSSFFLTHYRYMEYRHKINIDNNPNFKKIISFSFSQKTIILLFGILYVFSILVITISSYRPWYYFVIISIIDILIFIQIFSKDVRPGIILLEIIFILINLTYGVTLKYPFYFGWTDIIGHLFMSDVTYLSGHIVPIDLSIYYTYFPLYHILITESSYLLGIDLKTSLFIILGFIFAVHIIFIYYLFDITVHNKQLSLLTCLLLSISYNVVFYGAYMVTRTMAYLGFIIMLYLIYKGYGDRNSEIYKVLTIFFAIFIILVHQVSVVQIIIIMFILLLCERFVNNKIYLKKEFFILINVMFLAYWFFEAYLFVNNVIYSHTRPNDFNDAIIKPTVVPGNEWSFLVTHIDSSLFVFFAIIGIGYIFWKQKQGYACVFSLFVLTTIILYIPNPIQTLWQTMELFRFDRFELLLNPFMVFIMAAGINTFYDYLLRQISIKKSNTIMILLFAIFAFTSVISTASDSKEMKFGLKISDPVYFDNGELEGFNYVFDHIPFGSTLYSDYYTSRFFDRKKFNESEKLKIPYYYSDQIDNVDNISQYKGYFINRDKVFNIDKKELYENSSSMDNKIYSDYGVDIYLII